jgi:signal transduction histidine kinase
VTAVAIRYRGLNGAVVISRDISERKQQEIHLRQQQKLEAIGILAGGVAHEINNPINGIMNYAELILDNVQTGSQEADYASEIIQESERISQIVKNLLQFSRYEKQTFSLADICEIIHQSLTLIRTLIRKDQIDLQVSIDENLPRIRCRSQQIQQVIINLVTNARDALNEKYPDYHSDKILRIACSLHKDGDKKDIRIEIEDHGNGIPKEIRERIFEPFFSTKAKEKGTGLGLSISFGIILDHKGIINVESAKGEFTRFVIHLPIDPFSQGVNDE